MNGQHQAGPNMVTRFRNQNFEFDTNSSCQASDVLNESFTSSIHSGSNYRKGAPLYIICEKSQVKVSLYMFIYSYFAKLRLIGLFLFFCLKSFRSADPSSNNRESSSNRYIFLPVDLHEVKDTKNSFKKLCRACVPSSASQELLAEINQLKLSSMQPNSSEINANTNTKSSFVSKFGRKKSSTQHNLFNPMNLGLGVNSGGGIGGISGGGAGCAVSNASHIQAGFFKQLHESKWFEQLKALLEVANMICERMDDGSSVMVALEDGWDLTSQIVSLAELMMDPYYRTIEGFCVLIEREWLSMGHR